MIEMTEEMLVQALLEAQSATTAADEIHGRTAEELRLETGLSKDRLRVKLHALHAAGRLIVGKRVTHDITGRSQTKPTYALKGT